MSANNSLIVQIRRGTTAQTASYTGPLAELIVDTDQKLISVQDGVTAGGNYLAPLSFAQAAYNTANTANTSGAGSGVISQAAFDKANSSNVLAQSSYDFSNTVNIFTQSSYNQANTANITGQAAFNLANTANITGQAAFDNANSKYSIYGGTIYGSISVQQDVIIAGNLLVTGNSTTITANNLSLKDPLIFLGANNYVSDTVDIGIVAHYNAGQNAHTGIIRDPNLKEYIFFQGYTPELDTSNLINIADPSFAYANVYGSYFKGNLVANTANVSGNVSIGGTLIANTANVSGNVSIGTNLFVTANAYVNGAVILTSADLATQTFLPAYITMDPATVTVPSVGTATTYGTYNFGNLASIQTYGDYNTVANTGFYSVNDADTTPGHVEYIGFTGVTDFNRLVLNINYTASSGHTQDIDLYNYNTNFWDTFGIYSGSGAWQNFTLGLIDSAPYINSGNVTVRNYHVSNGNTSHRTWIDYVALENSITGGQGPRGATGATGATGNTGNNATNSGYRANSIIFADSTGTFANTGNLQFYTSNNTLVTANANVSSAIFVSYGASKGLVDIAKIALAQSFIV